MGNSCFEGVRQSGVGITSLTWRRPSLEQAVPALRTKLPTACGSILVVNNQSSLLALVDNGASLGSSAYFLELELSCPSQCHSGQDCPSVQLSKCPVSSSWFSQVALPAAAWAGIDRKEVFKSVSVVLESVLIKIQFDSQTQ